MSETTRPPRVERRRMLLEFDSASAAPLTGLVSIALMLVVCNLLAPGFVSFNNIMHIAQLAAFLGIVAIGETLVVLSGGIDLSVAWTMTGAGCVFTQVSQGQSSMLLPALAAALASGLCAGLLNGVGVAKFRISPIIMTLGMNNVMQGATLLYTNGTPSGSVAEAGRFFATGYIGPLSVLVLLWSGLAIIVMGVLRASRGGRQLLGVGENPLVSFLSGVRNDRVLIVVYALSGLAAALAGVLYASYSGASFLGMGDQFVLPSIAAVVIGGGSIYGGRGGYGGAIIGAIFLTVLTTLLAIVNVSAGVRDIIYGGVIIAALLLTRLTQGAAS
ncbi:MAG TPA: ABC transporter permease [Roseiarcus sp.]|nr:ABC transporter permease [Roseiarcus sp.]